VESSNRHEAFQALYERHRPAVRSWAYDRCRDEETAAAITDVALQRLWSLRQRGEEPRDPLSWLKREVEELAFESLYERHSQELWARAYARWRDADTAMDITQEAFVRLWKRWEHGEVILNPRA
jgi:DNA-directed RNA polymerase specialized sigma24 family protein